MTIPKVRGPAPSDKPKSDVTPSKKRITRPKPEADGPNRGGWASGPAPADAGSARDESRPDAGAPVSEAIANTVKLAYSVIGQNVEQGRRAASKFRQGEYNIRDVPSDVNALATRLLNLTRELSTTTFDILERLLKDPQMLGALQRGTDNPKGSEFRAPGAPPFYPTPGSAPNGQGPPSAPSSPSSQPTSAQETLALSCAFTGARRAATRAASLTRPDQPTVLALSTLTSLDGSLPPIGGVRFSAAPDGSGIVANVPIPDGQPAGLYSGVICAEDTQKALGLLTIEVLP